MPRIFRWRRRHEREEEGQGLVEYALALIFVAVVVVAILTLLGPTLAGTYAKVIAAFNGQTITGSGLEVIVTDYQIAVTGGPPECNIRVEDANFIVLRDGEPSSGESIMVAVLANGANIGSLGATSNAAGLASAPGPVTANNVSCPGQITVGQRTKAFR